MGRIFVGYQVVGETIILLFLKTKKTYSAMMYLNTIRTQPTQCHWCVSGSRVVALLLKHLEWGWVTAIDKADNERRK